ncbi:DUF6197 family protein [Streptomyces xanthochromogenes]
MTTPRTPQRPRTAPMPAPVRPTHPRTPPVRQPVRPAPAPVAPPWHHRLLPAAVRSLLADLGWWNNPIPQRPSGHLVQVIAVLDRYGWCQSLDVSPTGRLCIRGAQNLLEKAGHVTPTARARSVAYLQQTLAEHGVTMAFFAWNDLPDQDFTTVRAVVARAAHHAHQNGE